MKNTHGHCAIGSSSPSTQKVTIENEFDHPIWVDIRIEATGGYAKFTKSQAHSVETDAPIRVPRQGFSHPNRPGSRTVSFDLKQDGSDSDEDLEVSIAYAFSDNADENEKCKTVPTISPIVDLT